MPLPVYPEKMAYLADHPEEIRRMGRKAVERAGLFSWDSFVKRLDEYIEHHC